ncbi:hypothetical protein ILUMI_16754 [Ignelater luminosus]|uniref:Uncharacterized protein n=1 Tax=Ignelater luminosus TaxID=2038154 RepID=A0A8K0CL55_IGNLU|nr:hypothetical protein ILUMI_16754 [Ignelater luminosus]
MPDRIKENQTFSHYFKFDGISSAVKFLTGNLDSVDAERYNQAIEKLNAKQQKLIEHNNQIIHNFESLDNRTKELVLTLSKILLSNG